MSDVQPIIKKLRCYFANKQDVEKVILFGSCARNTQTKHSDIDIIVITKTDKRFFDRYDDFGDIYTVVESACDLLIYTPEEWERMVNKRFFKQVIKESKEIYVRGK